MTKKEIITKMSKASGITTLQAEKAFMTLFEGIKTSLKKGKRVTFSGFGSFEIQRRNSRKGRNPKTGEEIQVPARKILKFKTSPKFKEEL